jgi:hypothetical protein
MQLTVLNDVYNVTQSGLDSFRLGVAALGEKYLLFFCIVTSETAKFKSFLKALLSFP